MSTHLLNTKQFVITWAGNHILKLPLFQTTRETLMTPVCDDNLLGVLFQCLRPSGHQPPYSETGSANHLSDRPLVPGF